MTRTRAPLLAPSLALLLLVTGAVLHFSHLPGRAFDVWMAGLVVTGVPVAVRTLRRAAHGHLANDLVAMLAIAGAVALGQPLAGLIVVLMQTGGEALEHHAEGRASRALHQLEALAPRLAHRLDGDSVQEIPADQVSIGDRLLVRPGELVPCDGIIESGERLLDLAALTGEPLPVTAAAGVMVRSGAHNLESPFQYRATARAHESEYARVVELVRSAQASKAPLQRVADRYATWFTPITLLACGITLLLSRDPVRVLAVLVVATPCPLILATPVAIVGGISRAASRGIVFRHGAALEQLAGVDVAVFDKTGTLTIGRPEVVAVRCTPGWNRADVLAQAAAVERGSGHLLARTLVAAAEREGVPVATAANVLEAPGQGVIGTVGARQVAVGGSQWVGKRHPETIEAFDRLQAGSPAEGLRAYITVDGQGAGVVDYADRLRPEVVRLTQDLAQLGIRRIILLSGDREANVRQVARDAGITEARSDLTPTDKTAIVHQLVAHGDHVVMVGDGTNDAPALSAATVGVALASGGGGIAAEAADAVIVADDISRLAEAIRISRRTLRVAHQSIWTGLGLSGLAMVAAAAGMLPPAVGAMVQEAIDVAVIINALRAAATPRAAVESRVVPIDAPGVPHADAFLS